MRCQICGNNDAIRYPVLPELFELGGPGDRRTTAMGMVFLTEIKRRRARSDALNLCQSCIGRVEDTCQFWREAYLEEGEQAEVAKMLRAHSMGATEGELSTMVEAFARGLPVVMPGSGVPPSPATGCNPEGGGNVIYLPNARPRVRVRPGRQGGRQGPVPAGGGV